MSTVTKDRPNVVSFEARRSERTSVEVERQELEELRRELERERTSLAQQRVALEHQRASLEQERAEFEEDLGVLEDQRKFLDIQRETVRKETAALEAKREVHGRSEAIANQRQRVESVLEDARQSREAEKLRLKSEMATLFQQHAR